MVLTDLFISKLNNNPPFGLDETKMFPPKILYAKSNYTLADLTLGLGLHLTNALDALYSDASNTFFCGNKSKLNSQNY